MSDGPGYTLRTTSGFTHSVLQSERTDKENEFILNTGCDALKQIRLGVHGYNNQSFQDEMQAQRLKLEESRKQEFAAIDSRHKQELAEQQKLIAAERERAENAEASKRAISSTMNVLLEDERKRFQEQYDSTITRLETECAEAKRHVEQARSETARERDLARKSEQASRSECDKLRTSEKETLQAIHTLQMEIQRLNSPMSSQAIGAKGEADMVPILVSSCKDFDYEDTHSLANQGDYQLRGKGGTPGIMMDSKKFNNQDVPKKDREKLKKNVDDNAQIGGGIMWSWHTHIATWNHGEIEWTPKNKPILPLCVRDMDFTTRVAVLTIGYNCLQELIKCTTKKERDALERKIKTGMNRVSEIIGKQENTIKHLKEALKNAEENRTSLNDLLEILNLDN